MPLFELFRFTKAKLDSSKEKISSRPEDEVVELVWEDGQISMQSQSRSRNSQASMPPIVQSNSSTIKEIENGSDDQSVGILNEIPVAGSSQDDDSVPWLNQRLDESLQPGDCSELFPDVSEVTINEKENDIPDQTYFPFFRKNSLSTDHESTRHGSGISQCSSSRSNLFKTPPIMYHQTICEESEHLTHKPSLINFSHFVRPVMMAKENLHSMDITARQEMGRVIGNDVVEARILESDNRTMEEKSLYNPKNMFQTKIVSSKESDQAKFVGADAFSGNDERACFIFNESCKKGQESGKNTDPAVQCSSICSGNNSLEGPSDAPLHSLKRRNSEIHEMDSQCEDVEEESMEGSRKGAACFHTGSGSKRSRSAKVHNLSERKRRDRINEKMRALQELIPNCNKVDKASMLDEAIEYLKSLQVQVQVMSMASGYYIPPTMFPPGVMHHHHHMHAAAHMPHYPTMGMGYCMGMPDMNAVTTRVPMVQVHPQFLGAGLHPLSHPGMARVPGSFLTRTPMEINGSAVRDLNSVSKDRVKNKTLRPMQSSSCSDERTKKVSGQISGSS